MKLYIRTPNDPPHARHAKEPGIARCGQPLGLAKEITEAQALVFLNNRRCGRCFPGHSQAEAWSHHA